MEEIRARISEMPWRCEQLVKFGGKPIKSELWWSFNVYSQIQCFGGVGDASAAYGYMTFDTPWWSVHFQHMWWLKRRRNLMLSTESSKLICVRPQPPWSCCSSSFPDLESFWKPIAVDDPWAFAQQVEDDEYCGDNRKGDRDSVVSEISLIPKLPSSVEKTHEEKDCSSHFKLGPITAILYLDQY